MSVKPTRCFTVLVGLGEGNCNWHDCALAPVEMRRPAPMTAENRSARVFISVRELKRTAAELKNKNQREAIESAQDFVREGFERPSKYRFGFDRWGASLRARRHGEHIKQKQTKRTKDEKEKLRFLPSVKIFGARGATRPTILAGMMQLRMGSARVSRAVRAVSARTSTN
jgi:hypothetical protein